MTSRGEWSHVARPELKHDCEANWDTADWTMISQNKTAAVVGTAGPHGATLCFCKSRHIQNCFFIKMSLAPKTRLKPPVLVRQLQTEYTPKRQSRVQHMASLLMLFLSLHSLFSFVDRPNGVVTFVPKALYENCFTISESLNALYLIFFFF